MRHQFLLWVTRSEDATTIAVPLPPPSDHRRLSLGGLTLDVISERPVPTAWLALSVAASGTEASLTEGSKTVSDPAREIQSGSYNDILIDGAQGTVAIITDFLATLPLYYTRQDGRLFISNSLSWMQAATARPIDESAIAQWFLLAGWTVDDRTLLTGVKTLAAGTKHTFRADAGWQRSAERLARTWTGITAYSNRQAVEETVRLWNQAVDRSVAMTDEPIGLMLSGGLDSRMVAGGMAERGADLISLTHGNTTGGEAMIAKRVAAAINAPWLTNSMDESYSYDRLNLFGTSRDWNIIFNPIWSSSGHMLAQSGVRHFTTGAGLEGLLGGRRSPKHSQRFIGSLVHPRLAVPVSRLATSESLADAVAFYVSRAAKRHRNYRHLLTPTYRSLIDDTLPSIGPLVQEALLNCATDGRPTAQQVEERYGHEVRFKKLIVSQELQLAPFGKLIFPSYDLDFLEHVTNLSTQLKFDHRLYYKVIRRLYPRLADLPTANLGRGVNRPQLFLELGRAWDILRDKRLSPWINFEEWLRLGDNLQRHEDTFLANDHFFDRAGIRTFFNEFRSGARRLYDGNETLAFLSAALAVTRFGGRESSEPNLGQLASQPDQPENDPDSTAAAQTLAD